MNCRKIDGRMKPTQRPGASLGDAPSFFLHACAFSLASIRSQTKISAIAHSNCALFSRGHTMSRILVRVAPILIIALAVSSVRAETPATGYKLQKTIKIGGEGGWDYLTMDSEGRRLYIARADRVTVFDIDA